MRHGVRAALITAALALLTGCSLMRGLAWDARYFTQKHFTSNGRLETSLWRASELTEQGRYAEAEKVCRDARGNWPGSPHSALAHARALAGLGRTGEALAAIERAAQLGSADSWSYKTDPIFDGVRSDPRFSAALRRVEINAAAQRKRIDRADARLAAATAPAFPSFAALTASFEREESRSRSSLFRPYIEREISERALRMRRIAALERYLADHPAASDRADASLAVLRQWTERAGWTYLIWDAARADDVSRAVAEHAEACPEGEGLREARLYDLAARAFRSEDDAAIGDAGLMTGPPAASCASVLPDLEAFLAVAPEDEWTARAAALQAICLDAARREDAAAFRTAKARYDGGKAASAHAMMWPLDRLVKTASIRHDGLPDFTVRTLDGKEVTPASLRGKVVLLNFWSPG